MKKLLFTIVSIGLLSGCSVENIVEVTPVMVTYEPQNVLTTSASLGGIVMSEGGGTVTEYGIVYGTTSLPTVNDNKIVEGTRIGEFYSNYEGFTPSTTYYYRAYGTNAKGNGYGDTYSFTTQEEAQCNPARDNFINTGLYGLDINYVDKEYNPFTDGNIQFGTSSTNSTTSIYLGFKEINQRLPLTGTYTIVDSFYSQQDYSQGTVTLVLNGYLGWEQSAGLGVAGDKIYVENNNGIVTFIFCNLELSNTYTLNGKFTYSE
jgi:hypothetical protein